MLRTKSLNLLRIVAGLALPLFLMHLACGQYDSELSTQANLGLISEEGLETSPPLALADVLMTVPAKQMPTRVGCGSDTQAPAGTYAQWCNGYIEQELSFPATGVYQFDVTAFGSLADGVGPDMELRIDQLVAAKVNITASSSQTYSFQVAVPAGKHRFALAFTNDASTPTDRNLFLEKTVVHNNIAALASMQATAMATKVGCGAAQGDGYYGQLCNGYVEADIYLPEAGPFAVVLAAYGVAAGGAWPKLELTLDGAVGGAFDVSTSSAQNYLVKGNLGAGTHKLRLAFNNDYWEGSAAIDRNLYIGKVSLYRLGPIAKSGLKLVWSDEFTAPVFDRNKWNFEVNGDGGGNHELQYYTDLATNAYINNGEFVIQANKQSYNGKQYTSARVTTSRKFDFTYGRVEVRAKLPKGKGLWPAIWMMPTDSVYGTWPQSGEIDIMELVGHQPDITYGSIHYGDLWPQNKYLNAKVQLPQGDFSQDFHVFAVEWEAHVIRWYLDGVLFQTRTPADLVSCANGQRCRWPYDRNFFVILNVAVGGDWPGSPDASTVFPQTMRVDYVRVYQK